MAETEAKAIAEELSKRMSDLGSGPSLVPDGKIIAPHIPRKNQHKKMPERPPAPAFGPFTEALARWENKPDVPALDRLRDLAGEVDELRAKLDALKSKAAQAVVDGKDPAKLTAEVVQVQAGIEAREAAIPALEDKIRQELHAHYTAEIATLDALIEEGNAKLADLRAEYERRKAATEEAHRQYNLAHNEQRSQAHSRYRLTKKLAALGDVVA